VVADSGRPNLLDRFSILCRVGLGSWAFVFWSVIGPVVGALSQSAETGQDQEQKTKDGHKNQVPRTRDSDYIEVEFALKPDC
jgi:hypothetical protein